MIQVRSSAEWLNVFFCSGWLGLVCLKSQYSTQIIAANWVFSRVTCWAALFLHLQSTPFLSGYYHNTTSSSLLNKLVFSDPLSRLRMKQAQDVFRTAMLDITGNGDRHFPHLVVTVVTFHIHYTFFSHVKNLVKSICCKLDYLSGYTAIQSYDITNLFPCCYRSQN